MTGLGYNTGMPNPPPMSAMSLEELLASAVTFQASDLILKPGAVPALRVDGQVRPVVREGEKAAVPLPAAVLAAFFESMANERARRIFDAEGEVDLAYELPGGARFRVNAFRQMGHVAMVLRRVNDQVPDFEGLGLPSKVVQALCALPRGLILVTGVTGSGKSTTLAAMIDFMNRTMRRHIVTIEDPVEFLHKDKQCIVNQREIGMDSKSFASAMKHVVRESPDVILIGEMRDAETMEAAIAAAETGHLVFSTLHTVNAIQTVERILNFFPPHQHGLVRQQLSMVLEGVISQRLLRRKGGKGRVPAVEILLGTPTAKELLAEGKTHDLAKAIAEGHSYFGSQTFAQGLMELIRAEVVEAEEALLAADDPEELRLDLRGIRRGTRTG